MLLSKVFSKIKGLQAKPPVLLPKYFQQQTGLSWRNTILKSSGALAATAATAGDPQKTIQVVFPERARAVEQLQTLYPPEDAVHVVEHISNFWSVVKTEQLLCLIQQTTGLPWWGTIVALTIGLRFLMLPFNIGLLRNSLRIKTIMPEVEKLEKDMKESPTETGQRDAALKLQQLFKEKDCHPMRNFEILALFPPLVLSVFGAVHNLSIAEPGMITGGALWFTDLVATDPTWLLPTFSALTWLWVVESAAGAYYFAWPAVRTVARSVALAFIPVTSTLPCGVFVFWITSNLFAIARTHILRLDVVRKRLGIPLVSEIKSLQHLPKRQL